MTSSASPLGVAIVGLGWGVRTQLPIFQAAKVVVPVLIGRNQAKLQAACTKHQPQQQTKLDCTTDIATALQRDDVHLVTITTPPSTHAPAARQCLQAGKSVLLEKPFTLHSDEAQQLVDFASQLNKDRVAQKQQPLLALVDHELRALPSLHKARAFLSDSERFGSLQHAHCMFFANFGFTQHHWWHEREAGGGMMGALGTHMIDLLRFLTRREFKSVSAQLTSTQKTAWDEASQTQKQVTSDDYADLRLMLSGSGADAQSESSLVPATIVVCSTVVGLVQKTVKLCGTKGTLLIDLEKLTVTFTGADQKVTAVSEGEDYSSNPLPAGVQVSAFGVGTKLLAEQLKAAHEQQQKGAAADLSHLATFEDALAVQRVVDAAHKSNDHQGQWQQL